MSISMTPNFFHIQEQSDHGFGKMILSRETAKIHVSEVDIANEIAHGAGNKFRLQICWNCDQNTTVVLIAFEQRRKSSSLDGTSMDKTHGFVRIFFHETQPLAVDAFF